MVRLTWLAPARADLRDIRRHIALDSRTGARRMVERIHDTVARLRDFPESGRVVPEFSDLSLREVIVPPYRVLYRYRREQDLVQILSVLHSSRLMRGVGDVE